MNKTKQKKERKRKQLVVRFVAVKTDYYND